MGRLPSTFEGRVIQNRFPYTMPGEYTIASGITGQQYPDATFQNTQNKPFEVHRVIPRVYALASGGVLVGEQPDQELLLALIRVKFTDLGLDQVITKAPTLLSTVVKGSSERTWEFADPYYLPNNTQLQVVLDALTFPATFAAADPAIVALRVCLTLQGFTLVVGPPVA